MNKEVVYYDVLEDRLVVYIQAPWQQPFDRKSSWGGEVVFHVVYIGDF